MNFVLMGLKTIILVAGITVFLFLIFFPVIRFLHRIIFKRSYWNYKALKVAEWRLNEIAYGNGMKFFYPQVKYLGMWFYITFGGHLRLFYKKGHCRCENTEEKAWELQKRFEDIINENNESPKNQHIYKDKEK